MPAYASVVQYVYCVLQPMLCFAVNTHDNAVNAILSLSCRQKLEYERTELQAHTAAVQAEEQESRAALRDMRVRLDALQRQRDATEVRGGIFS